MKILYYFWNDGSYMYTWQHHHIFDDLSHHGIEIVVLNPYNYSSLDEANEACINELNNCKYDLFMTDRAEDMLYPSTLKNIINMGIPRLLINFDNQMDPYRGFELTQYFDMVMLLNIDNNPIYDKYKCPYVFAPYASNPYFFTDMRSNQISKTCFVGTPYGTRCRPINVLLRAEHGVDLFANNKSINDQRTIGSGLSSLDKMRAAYKMTQSPSGWKVLQSALLVKFVKQEVLDIESNSLTVYPALDLNEMNKMYSNYALSISMPEARNTGYLKKPVDIVRLRNFEIPMCAGLQISRYYKELAGFYEEDKEILFYRTNEELVDKVKYYTNPQHQKAVDIMKTNARKRSEAEHTWYKRFEKVFDKMGIKHE